MQTASDPPLIPEYNKPEAPGIWLNFNNSVSIYHIITPDRTFEQVAQDVFEVVREAQNLYPDWPRIFYLDILEHVSNSQSFNDDFVEFQQEFWFSVIAPFLTSFELPLTGPLVNPERQRNDLPDSVLIK